MLNVDPVVTRGSLREKFEEHRPGLLNLDFLDRFFPKRTKTRGTVKGQIGTVESRMVNVDGVMVEVPADLEPLYKGQGLTTRDERVRVVEVTDWCQRSDNAFVTLVGGDQALTPEIVSRVAHKIAEAVIA
jgi:hypothetical protein